MVSKGGKDGPGIISLPFYPLAIRDFCVVWKGISGVVGYYLLETFDSQKPKRGIY